VTGTLGMGPELVRIDGIVEEDTLCLYMEIG
jgi:hypothetical protein